MLVAEGYFVPERSVVAHQGQAGESVLLDHQVGQMV